MEDSPTSKPNFKVGIELGGTIFSIIFIISFSLLFIIGDEKTNYYKLVLILFIDFVSLFILLYKNVLEIEFYPGEFKVNYLLRKNNYSFLYSDIDLVKYNANPYKATSAIIIIFKKGKKLKRTGGTPIKRNELLSFLESKEVKIKSV